MNTPTDYEFDWDDDKAAANLRKHGVEFLEAMTVLADPLAMTFYDAQHSDDEERWVSVGRSAGRVAAGDSHVFRDWPKQRAMHGAS